MTEKECKIHHTGALDFVEGTPAVVEYGRFSNDGP